MPSDAEATAAHAGLRHVTDAMPGIRRRRAGTGFSYRRASGARVDDAATLARIRALAIPPAWTEVWICPDPRGHLQASGRDARGRKQYRYQPDWSAVRGNGKFDRVVAFGEALPGLRRRLRRDLAKPGYPREKVLAIVVALLGETLVRVGNPEYARENRSYGLTTLRNRHVEFLRGGRARFRFRGKGGLDHEVELDDRRLVKLLRGCRQLPGQSLFQYRDDDGVLVPVDSGKVNDYLRDATGDAFSAKDFRTWGATLAAFQRLARGQPATRRRQCTRRAAMGVRRAALPAQGAPLGRAPPRWRTDPPPAPAPRTPRLRTSSRPRPARALPARGRSSRGRPRASRRCPRAAAGRRRRASTTGRQGSRRPRPSCARTIPGSAARARSGRARRPCRCNRRTRSRSRRTRA